MSKKWIIAIVATFTHLCLGTVYAWSYFQTPITQISGWSNAQVAWTFSLSIFMLGLTASWGGAKMEKWGPRKLAIVGGILYALGYIIASVALTHKSLVLLYAGFGIIGGIGLGLAYVTPVATVSRWFAKKQGLATGMVVMGFGFGAFVMSLLLAPFFMKITQDNLSRAFLYIGLLLLVSIPLFAFFLQLPTREKQEKKRHDDVSGSTIKISSHIFSKSFIVLWLMFLINIIAGMVFISFQSPLLQDILKARMSPGTFFYSAETEAYLVGAGATLIGVSSVFNGVGRFFWGMLSDKIGRISTFRLLLGLQTLVFFFLIFTSNPIVFSVFVCLVLLSYGGGFGVIPSLVKDVYGAQLMPPLYGVMLTAWGVGGIIGPQIVAFMKDHYGKEAGLYAFIISGTLLLIGFAISFLHPAKLPRRKVNEE